MSVLPAAFVWFTDLVATFWLVPAGYLLYSGMTDPELGGMSGAILAGVWFGFANVVSTLFNAVCEFERWANRGQSPD